MHLFLYKWYLKDGYPSKNIQPNNYNVFGTFICGGGSTMGYKLAGFNHLGGVEIDPKIAKVYQLNHKPKHLFLEDIRKFVKRSDIPDELYNLDLLDGSPPCSSFSMAGNREKDWGKKKVFKEGQAEQVLDDLFFEYIALAKKLQPKIVLAENVKGLIQGNAKLYVKRIFKAFDEAGYNVQLFLLNSASMGVPQKRERVFFICQRNDLNFPKLELKFNEEAIPFEKINNKTKDKNISDYYFELWSKRIKTDNDYGDIKNRTEGKISLFSTKILHNEKVANTIVSGSDYILFDQPRKPNTNEFCQIGTYPLDYDFQDVEPKYLIGMSVPPVMTAQIANQIRIQWLDKTTNKQRNGRL
jgi:DNA (cytosine-5)-methyltransferase 1